jgi:hypothetical protein
MAGIFRLYDLPMQDNENIDFIKVGADKLSAGMLVVANDVEGTYLDGEGALYTPVKPATVGDANLAIVAPEDYYHDAYGNRINIDDPTQKEFTTGDRIRVIRPAMNKKYFISNDLITGTVAAKGYLIPTAGGYGWTYSATDITTGSPKVVLYIEQANVKDTFVGLSAVTGVRVRVVRVAGL